MMNWDGVIGLFHKLPFLSSATFVTTGLLLAVWVSLSTWLGLEQHRQIVGIVFVVAVILFLAQAGSTAWNWEQSRRARTSLRRRLQTLTVGEKLVLLQFVDKKTRSLDLDRNNDVLSLESARVIQKVWDGQFGPDTFIVCEWAWEELQRKRDSLLATHN